MSGNDQNLPSLVTDKEIANFAKENKEFVLKLQGFQKIINKNVEQEKLEEHPIVKDARYLPISFMEMSLDEIFFGLWSTENFRWMQVSNEITGTLELRVFNPIAKCWITRTGVASIQIMTDSFSEEYPKNANKQERDDYRIRKNRWALDPDNKKAGALTNGIFAALKADCFKNACISIGKYFGRDVNRKLADNFNPLVPDTRGLEKELRDKLSELVGLIQDEEERTKLVTELLEAESKELDLLSYYKKMITKLEGGDK